jgi:hypothetical protein
MAGGRIVYVELKAIVLTSDATQDIWSLMAPSGNKLRLHAWELTSTASTATLLDINLHFISSVGSGGATSTEVNGDNGDDATIVGSVRIKDTAPGTPSGGLMGYQWEQLGPVGMVFTPEMRPLIDVSKGVAVTCNTAATPTLSGYICWEEL